MTYDVLMEPWIPAYAKDGTVRMLGLRDVLLQSDELSGISAENPMVEFGLLRLLILFAGDMLRPGTIDDLDDRLKEGRFFPEEVDAYINTCRRDGASFDLFDEETPFLQTPVSHMEPSDKEHPAAILDYTHPHGNNPVHFQHIYPDELALSPAQCARLLPAYQLFCTGMARIYHSGPNGAPPYYAVIQGRTLYETIVSSMLAEERIAADSIDDPPSAWRDGWAFVPGTKVPEVSFMQGLLFPARRILLKADEDGQVRHVITGPGLHFTGHEARTWTDPQVAYRQKTDPKTKEERRVTWRSDAGGRPPWLNLECLMSAACRPAIISQMSDMHPADPISVRLYGLALNQGDYVRMSRHTFTFPPHLMERPDLIVEACECIHYAEKCIFDLRKALRPKSGSAEDRLLAPAIVESAVQSASHGCEALIGELLGKLAADDSMEDAPVRAWWADTVNRLVRDAFGDAYCRSRASGDALIRLGQAKNRLAATLAKEKKGFVE